MVDRGKSVDVAYFDYAKDFDKVSHRLLLLKLQAYGIDEIFASGGSSGLLTSEHSAPCTINVFDHTWITG